MKTHIHTIPLGMMKVYLLKGEKSVLIDAGFPGWKNAFLRGLENGGVKPAEIALVVVTHGHLDHIGLASFIAENTRAKFAIHHQDRDIFEAGKSSVPPGVNVIGKALSALGQRIPEFSLQPTKADIIIGDDGLSLEDYGIPGKVVPTPGHTQGSVSVILESGEAFVGDLVTSTRFLGRKPRPPMFAEDLDFVLQSWRLLLESGVQTIYPAHGKPFSVDALRDLVS